MFSVILASLQIGQGGTIKPPQGGIPQDGTKPKFQINIPFTVTQEDFMVAPGSAYEISAASLRPDRKFENKILLSVGAPAAIYTLTAQNGKLSAGTSATIPSISKTYFWTDNQAIRTEANEFIFERDSSTYQEVPDKLKMFWYKYPITCMGKTHPGQRGGLSLMSSGDGAKWSQRRLIDFAIEFDMKYGQPRPMDNADKADVPFKEQGSYPNGDKRWWVGGGDRTELYSCPFTGNLYITTRIISGPSSLGSKQENTTLLLGSTDMGATWKLIATHDAWSPTVMTSTSDGRLWMLQEVGKDPVLRVTGPAGRFQLPSGVTAKVVRSENIPAEGPASVDMEAKIGQPAISRIGGLRRQPGVMLAYQIKNSSGNQEYKILEATINSKNEISSSTIDTVYAEGRSKHSAMYGAFIQPELVGEPTTRHNTDGVCFYWYKARKDGTGTYAVQYVMYEGTKRTQSGFLSTKGGAKREWSTRKDPGDYIKGTSYFGHDGDLRFVPFWVEPDGVHAAVISRSKK